MKKIRLNSVESNFLNEKMSKLEKLNEHEVKQIFGGATSHKSNSKCTSCDDCMCDGQFENSGPDLDNLTEVRKVSDSTFL